MESVILQDGVTSIGDFAFCECASLSSVDIPGSVASIGIYAFQDCRSLTSITIPNGSIGMWAFYGCSELESVILQDGVTSIDDFAFYGRTKLPSITIPGSVESIGMAAFNGCSGLESVILQDGVKSIGEAAFYDCTKLPSVTIPSSVESIGGSAFEKCNFANIISKAETAPTLASKIPNASNNVYIPAGALQSYQSRWSGFGYNFIEQGRESCTFNGNSSNAWSDASNWEENAVPTKNCPSVFINADCQVDADAEVGAVTVATGMTLTVDTEKTLKSDGVTLENGAQLFNNGTVNCNAITLEDGAQLFNNGTVNSSKLTVKKDITGYDTGTGNWYLVSPPVDKDGYYWYPDMLTSPGEYDLYRFDQAGDSQGNEWLNYKAGYFELENQRGYLYASKNDRTIVFSGVFADTEAKTLAYDADAEFAGFNLVGNPYPCNAYLADGRSFYRMNESGTELIVESENPAIAPCEGVFVQAHGTGESLRFTTSAPQGQKLPTVALTLMQGSGTAIDRAIVHLGDGGMLSKMMLNDNNTKLYITQGGKDFAVVSTTAQGGEMPVNFKAAADGTYTLAMNVDNVSVKYLHLVDNLTGNDVDLLAQDPSYTFSAKATNDIARFKLVFSYNDVMEITANQDPDHKKNYYSTFYSSTNAYEVPEGVTAYTGAVNGDVLNLTSITTGIIPAGEAVILRLTTADNTATKQQIALSLTSKTGTMSKNNALTGTDVAKTLGANDYALSLGQNGVGFYKWEDKTIDAHKAYLELTSQAKAFTFRFDDEETDAIHGLTPALSEGEGAIYNLNGVRVNDSYKGIVIKNGKKIYQK